jgi:2-polyprenyl-6-methoxyphenol hydroxylase-like FAD-dependent oxidoreductase
MSEDDHGVQVTFERSAPRAFDLVVGADGLHSSVRGQVFGDEAEFVRGLGCYVAVFSTANQYRLSDAELWYSIPGKRDMSGKSVLLYPVQHNQEVRAMFYFAAPNTNIDRHNIAEQKQLVAKAFANETWEVPGLLDAMWRAPEFYCDQVALVQMEHWSRGRVALLGDAAYSPSSMSGMGTSLALIGAYVLAGELAATAVDEYSAAFTSYQRQMREAVRRAQKFARDAHRALLPKSEYQMWMAHQVMRLMTHWPFKGMATSGVEKAANTVTLKGYGVASHATPLHLG